METTISELSIQPCLTNDKYKLSFCSISEIGGLYFMMGLLKCRLNEIA